jgi:hypothetical protein
MSQHISTDCKEPRENKTRLLHEPLPIVHHAFKHINSTDSECDASLQHKNWIVASHGKHLQMLTLETFIRLFRSGQQRQHRLRNSYICILIQLSAVTFEGRLYSFQQLRYPTFSFCQAFVVLHIPVRFVA